MPTRIPHVFALLTYVVLAFSLLSYVIPSGAYERESVTLSDGSTRQLVVPDSYRPISKHFSVQGVLLGDEAAGKASPVSLLGFVSAFPRGMQERSDIIFFIFVLGAAFGILRRTGVIMASLDQIVLTWGHLGPIVVAVAMLLMGAGASVLGMAAEFIPLVPVFVVLSRQLGYDRVFGLAVVILSTTVGFAAATTNPFTVSVAQNIAGVPIHSGTGFRVMFFGVSMVVTVSYLLRYGWKVRENPSLSLVADLPEPEFELEVELVAFQSYHWAIIASTVAMFGVILYGVQFWAWSLSEMAGGFVAMGILAAVIGRLSTDDAASGAIEGMRELVVAALVVGFAQAVVVVLDDAQILDTLVHWAAWPLKDLPTLVGAEAMLVFQTVLNLFIPSGPGQAVVSMPLLLPFGELVGVTPQTTVFAFQCGDGLSNMVIPTSGTLMAMLLMADVPYERWIRFCGPLFLQLMGVAAIFLMFAVLGNYA